MTVHLCGATIDGCHLGLSPSPTKGESLETLPLMLVFMANAGLVFLALREVVCWYSKINRRLQLLEEGLLLLRHRAMLPPEAERREVGIMAQ